MFDRDARMTFDADALLHLIDHATALIEQAFLAAGLGLGEGLDRFNGLSRDLGALLGTLQGTAMAEASTAIGTLADRLTAVSGALPRDLATLERLAVGNDTIAKHLDGLFEHIRMMTIIASSARIEAAVFPEALGLYSFTTEMTALTAAVRAAVGRCAADHATTTKRLNRLHAAQAGLDRDFRERLLALAEELSQTFTLIEERQDRSQGVAADIAACTAAVASSAGTALMVLQSGDAARQRLEHIAAAIRLGREIAEDGPPAAGIDADSRPAMLAALYGLQAAQLTDVVTGFAVEADEIDDLLRQLDRDAEALLAGSRTIIEASGSGAGSFLGAFRAGLADATNLVGTCERARRSASDGMAALRTEVTELGRTIADLDATTRDLIVVGINAGLKAARLGLDGRSLMVIADELKRLAGLISTMASQLMVAYEALVAESRSLESDVEADGAEEVGTSLLSIAGALEGSDCAMNNFVSDLQDKARHFDGEISTVRQRFGTTAAAIAALDGVADSLAARQDGAWSATHLDALLGAHYTMARERDIHATTLGLYVAHPPARQDDAEWGGKPFAEAV